MLQSTRSHVLIFLGVTIIAMSGLAGAYFLKDNRVNSIAREVTSAREVISQTQEMMAMLYGTLSIQRGYLLAGDRALLAEYDYNKARLTEALARLKTLTQNDPAQTSRMDELQHHYLVFSETLDSMIQKYKTERSLGSVKDLNKVSEVRKSFDRVAMTILEEEKSRLKDSFERYFAAKGELHRSLSIGIFLTLLILTILNAYLMLAQDGGSVNEGSLREAEERLRLAIRGTNDGVYDWNLITQAVYWSPQFKGLLGFQDDEVEASRPLLETLIHPEDRQIAAEATQRYLNRESPELSVVFRVKHRDGYWIWVQKRGKALFDEDGRAVRLTGTYSDITSLKEYESRLEESKNLAEKANAAKTEFLAHMSHEIRTPLTSISGVAEILMSQKEAFTDRHQQLVNVLSYSTQNLKELINDILDFSKIESGQMELEKKPFALAELFQEVISVMTVRAHEKGLKFSFLYDDVKDMRILGDRVRVRQILVNLIGNALKFTHQGSVDVHVRRIDEEGVPYMQIQVADTGIGIDKDHFELVFERFRQADASVSRKYGGSGLGLPISRSLAESMGGSITLDSEMEKGSVFTVTVPLHLVVDEPKVEALTPSKGVLHQLKVGRDGRHRVLLVEDYEGNIVVISYILEALGCDFEVARTGLQAVNAWKERAPDLILMDVQMPEMDGLTATRQIRNMEQEQGLPRTPIIGMTAHAFVEDKDKCVKAGMDSYLAKPIAENDLVAEMELYLNDKTKARHHDR